MAAPQSYMRQGSQPSYGQPNPYSANRPAGNAYRPAQQPSQGGYDPVAGAGYQPVVPVPQKAQSSGDYSAYSPQPAQRAGYSPQQIHQSMNQYNAGGKKGNWQSYLPSHAGGYSYGDDMPLPPSAGNWQNNYGNPGGEVAKSRPGGLRAYSDYQPPSQGGYQPDPRIIQPYQPAIPPVSQGPQPFDYAGIPPWTQPSKAYERPTVWSYAQQQPQVPQSTFDAQYGQYGGGYASTPNTNQRDAFIQRLNDSMAGYQANSGVYQGQGAPPPSWGQAPQVNVPQMWSDAGSMVQSGWKNPLIGLM